MAEDLRDIASIRAEIGSLRHRRSLLQHTLLSHPRTVKQLKTALAHSQSSQPIHRRLQTALRKAEKQHALRLQHAYRSVAGVTAFKAKDPDPHAPFDGEVLGVRIDVFSRRERQHVKPYFLLLVREEPRKKREQIEDSELAVDESLQELDEEEHADTRLRIHKHTIPPFIPLASLAARYLQARSPTTGALRPQNLQRLAQHLRSQLVVLQARMDALAALEEQMPTLGDEIGMREFRRLDAAGKEFEIVDELGNTVRVVVADEPDKAGRIVVSKTVVRTLEEDGFEDEEGGGDVDGGLARKVGRRYWHVERGIMGGDKSVEGILERLKAQGGA